MHFVIRGSAAAFAVALVSLSTGPVRAGDDGAAPLWAGVGSIIGPFVGFGKDDKPAIEYREHGKLVIPPKIDLPPPGAAPSADAGAWPVNQEIRRKQVEKEAAKKEIAGQGDARLRYTHPFDPKAPVTVRASDQTIAACANGNSCQSPSSPLGSLNPMSWVGIGHQTALGPEPDREWLTDPPKGFRAPVGPTGQAAN